MSQHALFPKVAVVLVPHSHQITIRSAVASGCQTELPKIVNEKGDWMFYDHSKAAQTGLDAWWLIDLRAFRAGLDTAHGECAPDCHG